MLLFINILLMSLSLYSIHLNKIAFRSNTIVWVSLMENETVKLFEHREGKSQVPPGISGIPVGRLGLILLLRASFDILSVIKCSYYKITRKSLQNKTTRETSFNQRDSYRENDF